MNLHVLKLFYTVAATGSVTKASKKLNISQPAISAQIRKFEKDNDIILFEIKGRQLILTPLGHKLIKPLEKMFAIEDQVQNLIEDYHNSPHGKLRIVGNYLATSVLIPRWAALFKKRYTEVEVHIATVNSHEALEKLTNFEADVAIFGNGGMPVPGSGSLKITGLYKDEFWFVVSPGHKFANREIPLSDMITEPFIMREAGSVTREQLFQLCKNHGLAPPQIELQFNGLNETIHAVIAGYGASFVSSLVASGFVERGELAKVNVAGVHLSNSIVLCTRDQEGQEVFVHEFASIAFKNKFEMPQ